MTLTISEMIGDNMVKCTDTFPDHEFSSVNFTFPAENETDWPWAVERFNLDDTVTSVRLCWACTELAPSILAKAEKSRVIQTANAEKKEAEETQKVAEARQDGISLYTCNDCEQVLTGEELIPIRYCSHCESAFDASDGRNCTSCNRPFTSKVTLQGCPDCADNEDNGVTAMNGDTDA